MWASGYVIDPRSAYRHDPLMDTWWLLLAVAEIALVSLLVHWLTGLRQ